MNVLLPKVHTWSVSKSSKGNSRHWQILYSCYSFHSLITVQVLMKKQQTNENKTTTRETQILKTKQQEIQQFPLLIIYTLCTDFYLLTFIGHTWDMIVMTWKSLKLHNISLTARKQQDFIVAEYQWSDFRPFSKESQCLQTVFLAKRVTTQATRHRSGNSALFGQTHSPIVHVRHLWSVCMC